MRYIIFVITLFVELCCVAQNKESNVVDLESYVSLDSTWICDGAFLDTLYNPSFYPNPSLYPISSPIYTHQPFEVLRLRLKVSDLRIDKDISRLHVSGIIEGGWHTGRGSEVLVMTAESYDTVCYVSMELPEGVLKNKEQPSDSLQYKCVRFKNIDYCYSTYSIANVKEFRVFCCELSYNGNSNVLFFGLDNCIPKVFDLRAIIENY